MIRQHERSAADRSPAYLPPRTIGPSPGAIFALIVVHFLAVIGLVAIAAYAWGAVQ